ncbi:uncharacterized protein ACJ7VT_017167 [Polymixia lowei]
MSTAVAFHAQLASIMEVLANAAVAEICELVDSGYAVLHLEISRSQKENEALRRKIRLMELKVARASALRAAGVGSSVFASSRYRDARRTHAGEVPVPRVTTQVPARCEDKEPSTDTGQDTTQRKQPVAVEPVKLKTPVIKLEKDDETWVNPEHNKGFHHVVDEGPRESSERILSPTETEAPPSVTKKEVSGQDGSRSCSWSSRDVDASPTSASKHLAANPRSESSAAPVGYDCMMYGPQLQHGSHTNQNPSTEDPSCSYSLNTSVSISAPSDSGDGFPFAISDVTHAVEHQPPAVFPDSRQRAPLAADEPHVPARKEIPAATNAFAMREDWMSQDGFNSAANYNRDDPGGKSFICSFCGKTLACLKNLKTHMRVHTGEKPFSCALCGKRFSDSSNLKRHQSVHTGEKRYGCVHCGKRFAQSGSLKVHMSVHTGCKQFRCPHCGKTFISAIHLRRHISVHDAEKQPPGAFQ